MNRKRTSFCAFTAVLFLTLMAPELTHADFQKIRINLLGMTCEFCERALEKNLSRVPGVESARAWLDRGVADVTLKKGTRLDIQRLARAVKDGGLTLEDIQITVNGKLIEQEGKLAFKVGGSDHLIPLKRDEKVEAFLKRASELKLSLKIAADQIRERLWTVETIETL